MTNTVKLCEIKPNDEAIIEEVAHRDAAMKTRLSELGFRKSIKVRCVGISPVGGMRAYLIKGAVISIRDRDAEGITVRINSH